MNNEWSRPTKYIVGVGLAVLGLYVLYLSRTVIPLLIVAALIAVIVHPAIRWLHRKLRLPRGVAVVLVYLLLLIIVPLTLTLATPATVNALLYVVNLDYEDILRQGITWLSDSLMAIRAAELPAEVLDDYIDQVVNVLLSDLRDAALPEIPQSLPTDRIVELFSSALSATFNAAASLIGEVFSTTILLIFILLSSIYLSLSGHIYLEGFRRLVPAPYKSEIDILLKRIGRLWDSFFRGELTLMVIIGVICWLGLTIIGVPGAISLGIIAGLLELIPNLGPVLATIPAVIVALLQGSTYLPISPLAVAGLVLLFYILVQQLEYSLIVPRVLGDALDLPALVVLTGVLVGATAGGILGALLATPIIATAREILHYVYHKMQGEQPYPPVEQTQDPIPPLSAKLIRWLNGLRRRIFSKRSSVPSDADRPTLSNPNEDSDKPV